ncbi:MAG: PAS domain S-box protein [Deltaproteobacteria bacterium]|nr:PAS domain S-box protein [Deltaproteobacteria bacterium]
MKIKPIILRNIWESLPVGLMVIDPGGEVITINRAASEILGYSLEAFEGKGWGDLFFDDEKNTSFNQIIIDIVQERRVNLKRSVSYVTPTGKILQLSITGSFLREDGEIAGIVVLINDVTELHQAHAIEKTVLEEKNALQHERAESIKNLAEGVAHQIRNPVTAIGGFSMRILNKLDQDDPNRAYLAAILKGTKRLEDVVTAVSSYTKLLQIEPKKVAISEVLEKAKAGLSRREAELSKKIEWTVQLFTHALNELFLNALEFCKEDQVSIEVSVFEDASGVNLEIKDSGTGISEQDRPYIFDPFFTTKAVGVGMGLCKVKRIISEHKGEITVEGRLGKGTQVKIRLPQE